MRTGRTTDVTIFWYFCRLSLNSREARKSRRLWRCCSPHFQRRWRPQLTGQRRRERKWRAWGSQIHAAHSRGWRYSASISSSQSLYASGYASFLRKVMITTAAKFTSTNVPYIPCLSHRLDNHIVPWPFVKQDLQWCKCLCKFFKIYIAQHSPASQSPSPQVVWLGSRASGHILFAQRAVLLLEVLPTSCSPN